jgi:hypothetical protein
MAHSKNCKRQTINNLKKSRKFKNLNGGEDVRVIIKSKKEYNNQEITNDFQKKDFFDVSFGTFNYRIVWDISFMDNLRNTGNYNFTIYDKSNLFTYKYITKTILSLIQKLEDELMSKNLNKQKCLTKLIDALNKNSFFKKEKLFSQLSAALKTHLTSISAINETEIKNNRSIITNRMNKLIVCTLRKEYNDIFEEIINEKSSLSAEEKSFLINPSSVPHEKYENIKSSLDKKRNTCEEKQINKGAIITKQEGKIKELQDQLTEALSALELKDAQPNAESKKHNADDCTEAVKDIYDDLFDNHATLMGIINASIPNKQPDVQPTRESSDNTKALKDEYKKNYQILVRAITELIKKPTSVEYKSTHTSTDTIEANQWKSMKPHIKRLTELCSTLYDKVQHIQPNQYSQQPSHSSHIGNHQIQNSIPREVISMVESINRYIKDNIPRTY